MCVSTLNAVQCTAGAKVNPYFLHFALTNWNVLVQKLYIASQATRAHMCAREVSAAPVPTSPFVHEFVRNSASAYVQIRSSLHHGLFCRIRLPVQTFVDWRFWCWKELLVASICSTYTLLHHVQYSQGKGGSIFVASRTRTGDGRHVRERHRLGNSRGLW